MANGIVLFKSNITQLVKVRDMLAISCKMNGGQVILGSTNQESLRSAREHIEKAIELLKEIK